MKKAAKPRLVARSCRFAPGPVTVRWLDGKVVRVGFGPGRGRPDRALARELERVLDGEKVPASLEVDATGLSHFERRVLGQCAGIKPGHVMSYGELARAAGSPRAARAVGQVMARSPFALLIPCHRVVGAGGRLTGFGGGMAWKEFLLSREGWEFGGKGRSRKLRARSWRAVRKG